MLESFLENPAKPKYTKAVYQILSEVSAAETVKDKIAVLTNNNTAALRKVLKIIFDDGIVINTEVPAYKPDNMPEQVSMSTLHVEHKRLWPFQKGNEGALTPKRLTAILIQILESIPAAESAMLARALQKDKSLCPGITKDIVQDMFPNLLDGKLTRE